MTQYTDLITSQHNTRPKFVATVDMLTGSVSSIADLLESIPASFDLDTAVGEQLDIIGLWVGQNRYIDGVVPAEFFGFFDTPNALTFGEEGIPWVGGQWYEEGGPLTVTSRLNDAFYRMIIKAKIVKNHFRGGFKGIIDAMQFIFGDHLMLVEDRGGMAMRCYVGRGLTTTERHLVTKLDLIPRPAGVLIDGWGMFNGDDGWLGFEDQIPWGAVCFAEEGYHGPRHHLMNEFR